ncbi:MAG: NotI family restriction endonuclease [Saprospiraceae bacterium]
MSEINPLAELFGFPIHNDSDKSRRYRDQRLCPFNNKVPNCTKDKANDPLGVCSIHHGTNRVITCPIRFREDWVIVENAARFFFGKGKRWTSMTEVRLTDKHGLSAGNIDFILASYDEYGRLTDFGSLEVHGVYISGNLRNPFSEFMKNPSPDFQWRSGYNFPKPDYLSSSRKRLIPQMLYKGGIFHFWKKKQAVALQKSFFETLPNLPQVEAEKAEIAWFLYDLIPDANGETNKLTLVDVIYTEFEPALLKVTTPEPGDILEFAGFLQGRLDEELDTNSPDAPSLNDILTQ